MAKITLSDVVTFVSDVAAKLVFAQNNTKIEAAIEKTLSRDGTSPNAMSANLDMNSNKILNHPEPSASTDLATKNYGDTNWGGTAAINALASETAAAVSETAAATSETNAATSETNAATSATNAATSETNAATSETNASTSASSASTSASTATTQASAASTSASNASTSASTATTQASNASTSASAAASDATDTGNDATATGVDAASTAADVISTNADVVSTNADVVSTNADVIAAAAADGFRFTFDNSTSMADPGVGDFRLNNATVGNVTAIAFDATTADSGNPDVSDYITTWDDSSTTALRGTLVLRKVGTPATYAVFNITGSVTDNTGWLEVAVTHVQSNGSWSASDIAVIRFNRTGDTGAAGAGSGDVDGPGSSTDEAIVRFDSTTGKLLQDSGVTIDDSNNITVPGTVDGRDVATDGTKLDAIADNAEVNPTPISQGDAEAGSSTTEQIFTAERVKQAIAALETSGGADVQTITSTGNWTKPSSGTICMVEGWGGGASGGKGSGAEGQGGGGGGGYAIHLFLIGDLGATETCTIGAGGAALSSAGTGNAGGTTTFGSLATFYGGGGGANGGSRGGGGGGTAASVGAAASTTGGAAGEMGAPLPIADDGLKHNWSGGSGGYTSGNDGGDAGVGGGGGGAGNAGAAGGAGGGSRYAGAGGGGAETSGTVGAAGVSESGGDGGAGAKTSVSAGAGTVPGGGGGGGLNTQNSGAGAKGQVRVTTV